MIHFALYDSAGRIQQTGSVPEFMVDLQGGPGLTLVRGEADYDRHYVKAGRITERAPSTAALAGQVLTGLPPHCTIHINRQAYACNDPVAHLEFPYPGTYQIRVEAFPYLDAHFTLEQT